MEELTQTVREYVWNEIVPQRSESNTSSFIENPLHYREFITISKPRNDKVNFPRHRSIFSRDSHPESASFQTGQMAKQQPAAESVMTRTVPSSDVIFISWTLCSRNWIRNIMYLTEDRTRNFVKTIFWMSGNFQNLCHRKGYVMNSQCMVEVE